MTATRTAVDVGLAVIRAELGLDEAPQVQAAACEVCRLVGRDGDVSRLLFRDGSGVICAEVTLPAGLARRLGFALLGREMERHAVKVRSRRAR